MRFSTMTLGCKVNQYETQALESILQKQGHELVNTGDGCDTCIINTCAVTLEAERKSRQMIRRAKKLEPNARVAACGCYAQLTRQGDGSSVLLSEIHINELLPETNKTDELFASAEDEMTPSPCLEPGNTANRTRALLKIQDGCDNFCTYCIVPHIRGRSRSLPQELLAEYAKQLGEQGYKEIVITGIEISSFTPDLLSAIKTINDNAPSARLRLGSLDPAILSDDYCGELKKASKLCNHFHLSLQSGCDDILHKMGRKYNTSHVLQGIDSLRSNFPGCAVTADLITGFPGETEDDFNQTINFIKKAAFSDMHIFPYSPRPGTKAADMPGQIEKSIKKERARIAINIAKKMTENYKKTQIGNTLEVLFEQEKSSFSKGHSENYQMVTVKGKIERNSIHNVMIKGIKNDILTGEIV